MKLGSISRTRPAWNVNKSIKWKTHKLSKYREDIRKKWDVCTGYGLSVWDIAKFKVAVQNN